MRKFIGLLFIVMGMMSIICLDENIWYPIVDITLGYILIKMEEE